MRYLPDNPILSGLRKAGMPRIDPHVLARLILLTLTARSFQP
ncbi:hypothetical protein NB703_003578 [Pantoea ananatis]|uniref:Uncharacterized protein n=1 Tax=Pantoea ananas TaxID=553 RepID=A0AAJ1D1C9_PANAN|nr:hypothetical protein [Pantoea ananatis]MCW0352576.1 hypothetical protein [Pantoea ananatis]